MSHKDTGPYIRLTLPGLLQLAATRHHRQPVSATERGDGEVHQVDKSVLTYPDLRELHWLSFDVVKQGI